MAALVRKLDWAATPLGALAAWPPSLRSAVDICLDGGVARFVWWGNELVQIYNDVALSIMGTRHQAPGTRHPAALGVPARQAWHDAWEALEPLVERILATAEPAVQEDLPMVPNRGGACEPACWRRSGSACFWWWRRTFRRHRRTLKFVSIGLLRERCWCDAGRPLDGPEAVLRCRHYSSLNASTATSVGGKAAASSRSGWIV
jgi:hypothetical protein